MLIILYEIKTSKHILAGLSCEQSVINKSTKVKKMRNLAETITFQRIKIKNQSDFQLLQIINLKKP